MTSKKLELHCLASSSLFKLSKVSKKFCSQTFLHSVSKLYSANPLSAFHSTHENISTPKNKKIPSIGAAQIDYILAVSIFLIFFALTIQYTTDYFSTIKGTADIVDARSEALSLLTSVDRGFDPATWPQIVSVSNELILLLHMDNSTLDSALGNNGTLNGTATCSKNIDGKVRFGCQFDNKNASMIIVPDSASLNITDEITISAWVKIA